MVTRRSSSLPVAGIAIVLAAALACAPAGSVRQTGPAVRLSAETWDFGTLKRGEKRTGEIALTNAGTDTLSISLYPTCDCLEARIDRDGVAPGETVPIHISYLGDEIKERLTKTLYVESNDPVNPRIAVAVTGTVLPGDGPHLRVTPDPLLLDPEDPLYPEASLAITNVGKAELEIEEVRCFGCAADPNPAGLPIRLSGGAAGLTLKVRRLEGWSGTRWIEIETNDPVDPVKKVPFLEL
jgi:hypothetical protein